MSRNKSHTKCRNHSNFIYIYCYNLLLLQSPKHDLDDVHAREFYFNKIDPQCITGINELPAKVTNYILSRRDMQSYMENDP